MNYSVLLSNNKNIQFEMITLLSVVLFSYIKKIPKLLNGSGNNSKINYSEIKLSQFTSWNMMTIFYYTILNYFDIYNYLLLKFITINSTAIFITFHLLYLYDYNLIFYFPASNNMKFIEFHTYSFIVHIMPPIYFIYKYIHINDDTNYDTDEIILYQDINVGIYTMLFQLLWCFSIFNDFNIAKVYLEDYKHLSRIFLKLSMVIQFVLGICFSLNKTIA
jgi:hypothetical protein